MYNILMGDLIFSWDENKNKANIRKHGISFIEARKVFYDDNAVLFDDPDHSDNEERFLIIGISGVKGLCIVSHCYLEQNVIRIISARKATAKETQTYLNHLGFYTEGSDL